MRRRLIPLKKWTRKQWSWLVAVGAILGLVAYLTFIQQTWGLALWSGFQGKTLWDVLELLIVPVVLAIGGFLFSQTERKADREIAERRAQTERDIAKDRAQENLLQGYLDKMTELLLEKGLRMSEQDAEARAVARSRTLTVLRGLDGARKGSLLVFLKESNLVTNQPVVNLRGADLTRAGLGGADLTGANLSGGDLTGANLYKADLRKADLTEADLTRAQLSFADLRRANLTGANMNGADLAVADLRDATLTGAKLHGAKMAAANVYDEQLSPKQLAQPAIMPDGTTFDE